MGNTEVRQRSARRTADEANVRRKIVRLDEKTQPASAKRPASIVPPNNMALDSLSKAISQNMVDHRSIVEMLPDIELAMQILVSSILSPQDMLGEELNFTMSRAVPDARVGGEVIKIVQNHFENKYPILDILPKMLEDILFYTGSYPMLILPENSIDRIINAPTHVSFEAIKDVVTTNGMTVSGGLLGKAQAVNEEYSIESFFRPSSAAVSAEDQKVHECLYVADNLSELSKPLLMRAIMERRVDTALAGMVPSMEAKDDDGGRVKVNEARRRFYKNNPMVPIEPELGGDAQGEPVVMRLPSESTIPVIAANNPEMPVGYFVLLDKNGNPLSRVSESGYFRELRDRMSTQGKGGETNEISALIEKTRQSMGIGSGDFKAGADQNMEQLYSTYSQLIENNLNLRLANGIYGDTVKVTADEEIYRVMLARALAKQRTTVLYVPAQLITYFAFNYDDRGVGVSLLEKGKVMASIRAMLLLSNAMAAIKNSIGSVMLNITLDEDDPDPQSTVEQMLHSFMENHMAQFPLGNINPADITEYLRRSSVSVNIDGNTAYPNTKSEITGRQQSNVQPDTELEELMKARHIMSFGLTPEVVDATTEVDFATSVVNSNVLLAKRVNVYQTKLSKHLENFVRTYIRFSPSLMSDIVEALKEAENALPAAKRELASQEGTYELESYLSSIQVQLPRPDMTKIENQTTAFTAYVELLDVALDGYFSEEMMEGLLETDVTDAVVPLRVALRSHFIREWLRRNNVMGELEGILTSGDGDELNDIVDVHGEHVDAIVKMMGKFMRDIRKKDRKFEKELEKDIEKEEEVEEEEESETGDDGGLSTDGGDGTDDADGTDDGDVPANDDDTFNF